MAPSRLEQIGTPSAIVVGATSAVALASWFVFIRFGEPDWGAFAAVFEGSIVAGNAVLSSIGFLSARLREIRTAGTSFLLAVLPIALCFVVFSATSAGVSSEGFDDETPTIGAIALLCLLALAAALGGLLVFLMVVLPAVWLLRAIRPAKTNEGGVYFGMSRGELAGAALIFPFVILFAIAMVNMVSGLSGGSRRERQSEQLMAFITFQGEPLAMVLAWAGIVGIVVSLIIYRRARKARLASAS
jgi:hypothetical protein